MNAQTAEIVIPADTTDTYAEDALVLLELLRTTRAQLEKMAELRPTVTIDDLGGRNNADRAFVDQVETFRKRYDMIDVSALTSADTGDHDPTDWELLGGGSERFKVIEVAETEEQDHPTEEGETIQVETGETVYLVIDTENPDPDHSTGYLVLDEEVDESDANDRARAYNNEETMDNLAGFPFAHNYGVIIESWEVEEFAAAGFLVWEHHASGQTIAGIDGGGYSFLDAHWIPLFFARCQKNGWLVETSTGPRRPAPAS